MHAQREPKRFSEEEKMAWHTIAPKRTIGNVKGLSILQATNMSLWMMI
jgi:hypothetical protein